MQDCEHDLLNTEWCTVRAPESFLNNNNQDCYERGKSIPSISPTKIKLKFDKLLRKNDLKEVALSHAEDDEVKMFKVISPDEFFVHRTKDIPRLNEMHSKIKEKVS